MTAVHPRHWSSAPGASAPSMAQIPPPVDPAYSSLAVAASPTRSTSSQAAVRRVPHSPSFRHLPVTVPSYAFKQTPTAANTSPGPEPSPPPPPPTNQPSLPSHATSSVSSSSDLPSPRYRRGHRRSEVSMSSSSGHVISPPPLTRSWSSPSLTGFPVEPAPSVRSVSYQQHPSPTYSPELYYQIHRQSPAPLYGRPLELYHSSRSSSSSSVSSISIEPPSRYNGPPQMHARKTSVASVASMASAASSDSRHGRHSSIDSGSTSSSNGRATPQPDLGERRSRLRIQTAVPMDRSSAEVLLAANASKTSAAAALTCPRDQPVVVVPKQEKKVSRIKKALSFIAPAPTSSTPANVMNVEQGGIECNLSNHSIYESRRNKGDDNMSIRSTASSVSNAFKRMSWFPGSKGSSKSDSSSVIVVDDAASVREMDDINDESAEQDDDSVKKFVPSKKVDFIPKSILKNAGCGQVEAAASEEPLPVLTRESSLFSHSSSSSSSLRTAKPLSANHHPSSSVSFSPEIKIYTTWNSGEYDRKIPDAAPFSTYPLWMIAQIKEEINTYKMMEMEIHELSKSNTCFY
ncbi:hypothetical protein V1525DRAFT_64382 [Lipomyces kononenkoae]|uniref:Uncharacterized protein n=1 Tax=Lipomyces kononenkoae TaxID=34357 RepID=A0ACC3T6S1_LIPKO